MSVLRYGCTTWTLTKCTEKKLARNYTRDLLWIPLSPSHHKSKNPTTILPQRWLRYKITHEVRCAVKHRKQTKQVFIVNNNDNNNYNTCYYLDLARELKKLWNMKVTIVPIVIGALGTITKGLLKGLGDLEVGGRVGIIQTTALLRTARILRRVPNPETWGDLLTLRLQWKTIS